MGKGNAALHRAKRAKNDEFYTQKKDIEKELIHYHSHLKDKIVYCNCDDYRKSKFVEYFMENFEKIGLKKFISTGFSKDGQGTYSEYDGTTLKMGFLSGNGDALGEECSEILKQADVVVTNPPFSLFRKYVTHLMEYGKKFLIIGNMNAVTYKEIFPYIKNNELWLGNGFQSGNAYFSITPQFAKEQNYANGVYNADNGLVKFRNCVWFTNISHTKRNTPLDLYKKYSADEYPKYANYDAIEVSKVSEIPMDYNGVMGVPITFLDKYCPTQFEIVGMAEDNGKGQSYDAKWDGLNPHCVIHSKNMYKRIFIRRKKAEPIVEAQ